MTSLRRRLLDGGRVAGLFVQTPHPVVTELLGALGVDVLCVDQEHSAMGPETVHALVGGAALGGVPAIVRVADGTAHHIAAALDAGAAGVLVPRVGSAAAAEAAVRFARYPPAGERGVGPGRASGYGRRIAESLARADEETLVAVQIETRAALDVLDEILGIDGVDLIFVGPGDLSVSLGLAGGLADPRLRPVVEDVLDRAAAAGKATGVFAADVEGGAGWLARGVGLVLVGSDLGFLAAAVEHAWRSLDDAPPPP